MDRDIRTYLLFIGISAVAITSAGLALLVFGVSGISAEAKRESYDKQLERYGQNLRSRMSKRMKGYMRDGKCDYRWAKDEAPIGTNVSARVKYGWFAHTNGTVVGWARLDDGSVIGYNERPFRYVDRRGLYMLGIGAAMVVLLFFTLCACGWRLAGTARRARKDLELKDSFLDMVSHELNTPLASIVPLSSALSAGTIRDERRRAEALDTVKRESERMARMIGELLTMVRLRNGKTTFLRERFDLREAASAAADLVRARYPDCAILLHDGGEAQVLADRDKMEQVAINLMENACKYAGDGDIEVRCRKDGEGRVSLEVSDRGCGIPDERKVEIFERFAQFGGEVTQPNGLGLGLAIVAGLVKGMGGKVRVLDREGGGSTFVAEFPWLGDDVEGGIADG